MARKSNTSSCALCERSNLASICASCVNYRLNEYYASLKLSKAIRNSLYQKLERNLEAKKKKDQQLEWRMLQNEKIAKLKERLRSLDEKLSQDKAKVVKGKAELKVKSDELQSAFTALRKTRAEHLGLYKNHICIMNLELKQITLETRELQSWIIKLVSKVFPMRQDNKAGRSGSYVQMYNARLPKGLDPHSVPSEELAVSLGYMIQLLDFITVKLAIPALYKSGFAGSTSRIWQRNSYWDNRPSSQSKEYPLFIPRRNLCTSKGDTSWSDKSSSNFGVISVVSERKASPDSGGSTSNYSSVSPPYLETHKDLQKGISLLKKSVACVTAYFYNSLGFDVPPEQSTFEAFAKLLSTLSSLSSLKMGNSRYDAQGQRLDRSIYNSDFLASGNSSRHAVMMPSARRNLLQDSNASFIYSSGMSDIRKSESLGEGWDLVEHPSLPPPLSQAEYIEHWMPSYDR